MRKGTSTKLIINYEWNRFLLNVIRCTCSGNVQRMVSFCFQSSLAETRSGMRQQNHDPNFFAHSLNPSAGHGLIGIKLSSSCYCSVEKNWRCINKDKCLPWKWKQKVQNQATNTKVKMMGLSQKTSWCIANTHASCYSYRHVNISCPHIYRTFLLIYYFPAHQSFQLPFPVFWPFFRFTS